MGAEAGVPFFCVQIEVPAEAVDSVREFILVVRDAFNEVVKELTVILRIVVDVEDVDGIVVRQFECDEHCVKVENAGMDGGTSVGESFIDIANDARGGGLLPFEGGVFE